MYASRARYHEMMNSIKEFIKIHDVPRELGERVMDYVTSSWAVTKGIDTTKVLNYCPRTMKADLSVHLNRKCTRRPGPDISPGREPRPASALLLAARLEVIQDDDRGHVGVAILAARATCSGDTFWREAPLGQSAASARALTYCDLHCIKRDSLLEVLNFYQAFSNSFARNLVLTYNMRHRIVFRKIADVRRERELAEKRKFEPPLSELSSHHPVRKLISRFKKAPDGSAGTVKQNGSAPLGEEASSSDGAAAAAAAASTGPAATEAGTRRSHASCEGHEVRSPLFGGSARRWRRRFGSRTAAPHRRTRTPAQRKRRHDCEAQPSPGILRWRPAASLASWPKPPEPIAEVDEETPRPSGRQQAPARLQAPTRRKRWPRACERCGRSCARSSAASASKVGRLDQQMSELLRLLQVPSAAAPTSKSGGSGSSRCRQAPGCSTGTGSSASGISSSSQSQQRASAATPSAAAAGKPAGGGSLASKLLKSAACHSGRCSCFQLPHRKTAATREEQNRRLGHAVNTRPTAPYSLHFHSPPLPPEHLSSVGCAERTPAAAAARSLHHSQASLEWRAMTEDCRSASGAWHWNGRGLSSAMGSRMFRWPCRPPGANSRLPAPCAASPLPAKVQVGGQLCSWSATLKDPREAAVLHIPGRSGRPDEGRRGGTVATSESISAIHRGRGRASSVDGVIVLTPSSCDLRSLTAAAFASYLRRAPKSICLRVAGVNDCPRGDRARAGALALIRATESTVACTRAGRPHGFDRQLPRSSARPIMQFLAVGRV
uniref:Cyclic nucleotide-binding domain-containing protein n=1 Tax=Macrostomum lignano TaxID=282301 RepID=A0A1I8FJR7_9PLAT